MTLTMTDLEAALQDRTAELRDLETRAADAEGEVERQRRGERTREVVGKPSPTRSVWFEVTTSVRRRVLRMRTRQTLNAASARRPLRTSSALAEGEEIDLAVDVTPVPVGEGRRGSPADTRRERRPGRLRRR